MVGAKPATTALVEQLASRGFDAAVVDRPAKLRSLQGARPELILLSGPGAGAKEALELIRQDGELQSLPLLGDASELKLDELRALGVDDWIHSLEELPSRLESALKARRAVERDAQSRLRMEALLEIVQAATSSLELEQILEIAVEKIGKVITTDRCSIVLVEGDGSRTARVMASRNIPDFAPMQIDLARYPELRRSLETRSSVYVENAIKDPLMEEVRSHIVPLGVKSILVQPLICQDDLMGALFLRLSRQDSSFGREDQEFAQTVAAALANSVRNARLHTALKKKRDDLESAYVDRYRELNEANRRLKELNRLKDELIAVCSHDVRAPLQILLGHGRLLEDSTLSTGQKSSASAMVRQGRKILELVESLLERGKTDLGRLTIDPRLADVSELAQEVTAEMGILARERDMALRAEAPESMLVIGDEVKLREVLQNLISNALHHAKSEVVVAAQRLPRPDGEAVRICVMDDGPGIPKDKLHVIFDRYRHGGDGTGLGLAICREFIDLHGGEIWAENRDEGGACFVFTLPLARPNAPMKRLDEHTVPLPVPEPQQARVLVVEDEPETAAIVAEILRTRYRVEVARDGAEGLARAKALKPDLVVMDVFLPKLDGLDAAAALKSSTDTADIPVILLSAHQAVADKLRALNLGAVDYMGKPFQAMELLSRADRALQFRDTQRKLEKTQTLVRLAGRDPTTGLPDRDGVRMRLEQELARSKRHGHALSLALLTPAFPVTDRVESLAASVRRRLRTHDVLAHIGDARFVLLLPESTVEASGALLARLLPLVQEEQGVRYVSRVNDPSKFPDAITALGTLVDGHLDD
ncbi:MAG: ATP-binding protein [Myxococcaceae bacterium]